MRRIEIIPSKILAELCGQQSGAVRTYFDKSDLIRKLYWKRLEYMLNICSDFAASNVLDLGCGQGVFLPSLSKYYENVFGLDLDVSIAEIIKRKYHLNNITLFKKNIFDNTFQDNTFDLIFAPSVLEHFYDLNLIFSELKRILKKKGRLVFSSPTETILYEIGRKIFGYKKPVDHYHDVFEISNVAKKYFKYINKRNGPFFFIPSICSVYVIYVFEKC
ncbi:MAG: class I SAM-dependent methyltransferase [Desulfamplus sp.]|nr:class I SAM-dependent methyltransferase [Desulfamplus sp.]